MEYPITNVSIVIEDIHVMHLQKKESDLNQNLIIYLVNKK
jgi:hypothetical protein